MPSVAAIQSEGDLEVVLLHETHSILAEIVGPELYAIGRAAPEQSVSFHNRSSFNLFLILIIELFSEGSRSALIDQQFQNWSLLKGLHWLCDRHPDETTTSGLQHAVARLDAWLEKVVDVQFWCPEVNTDVTFPLKNEQLVWFGANTAKHHLIRLSRLLEKLESKCTDAGYRFAPQELPAVLAAMTEEVRSRMQYHATQLLELIGEVFFALNELINARFAENPTNRANDMTVPEGVTSDAFRDLYCSVMVFKRYDASRIRLHTPVTSPSLKMRY